MAFVGRTDNPIIEYRVDGTATNNVDRIVLNFFCIHKQVVHSVEGVSLDAALMQLNVCWPVVYVFGFCMTTTYCNMKAVNRGEKLSY